MKIYLIRHGETTSDVEDRYGGDYDDHLTDRGVRQSEELAEKLKNSGIKVIFASNRIRAQEVAKILHNKLKAKIKTDDRLRERNLYGPMTGMKKSEAVKKYPVFVERIKNTEDTIPGAENAKDFVKRIVDSFKEISKLDYKIVAIITHGGPIRRIFWEVLGIKKEQTDIKIADCAYAEIDADSSKFKLIKSEGINILN